MMFRDLITQYSSFIVYDNADFSELESDYRLVEISHDDCPDTEYYGNVIFELWATQHINPIVVAEFSVSWESGYMDQITLTEIKNSIAFELFKSKCMGVVGRYFASQTLIYLT